jgi:hypothetical protein
MRGCIIRCFPLRTSAVSGFSFSVSKDFPSSISLHAHRGGRGENRRFWLLRALRTHTKAP